jgi:exodeoxyribonuclease-1
MPIASHPNNKNCVIVYDLRVDPTPLLELPPDEIFERIFTPTADLPEDTPRVALKGVHLNKCPVLAPFEMMRESEAARLNLDINQCRRNWKAIHDHLAEVEAKAVAVFDAHAFEPDGDAEAALYDGFVSDDDRKLADQVRRTSAADLADGPIVFADNRLNELLFRYRARHFPETLVDAERDDWNNWLSKRLEFAPDGGLTLDDYDEVIAQLMERVKGEPAQLQLLLDLKAWSAKLRQRL